MLINKIYCYLLLSLSITGNGQCLFNNISQSVCSGTPLTVAAQPAAAGLQYTWVYNGSTPLNAITGAATQTNLQPSFTQTLTNITSAPATANYLVTVSSSTCAPSSFSLQLTVNPIPTVNTVPSQTLCAGEASSPIVFTSPVAGASFSAWFNSSADIGLPLTGQGNVPSFIATNSFDSPITSTITVSALANNCFGNATPVSSITVNPRPLLSTPSSFTACSGSNTNPLLFTSNLSSTQFTWTNSQPSIGLTANGQGNIASFVASNNTNVSIEANVNVVAEAFGCTNLFPGEFTITVHPIPSISAVSPQTICHGGTSLPINLSGPVQNTFVTSWNFSSPFNGSQQSGGGQTIPAQDFYNYGETPVSSVLTATPIANGCVGQPQVVTQISVNPQVTVLPVDDITLCAGESVVIGPFETSAPNAELVWELSPSVPGFTSTSGNSNSISFILSENLSQSGFSLLSLRAREPGCTLGDESFVNITYHPRPSIDLSGISNPIQSCSNVTLTLPQLNANFAGSSIVYAYSGNAMLVQGASSGDYPPTPSLILKNENGNALIDTLWISASYLGCAGNASPLFLNINAIPSLVNDQTLSICNGDTLEEVSLTTNPPLCQGLWQNSGDAIGLPTSYPELVIPQFVAQNESDTLQQASLNFTLTDASGCYGFDTVHVMVLPASFNANANFSIVQLDSVNYSFELTNPSSSLPAQWYVNGNFIGEGQQISFSPPQNGEYLVESYIETSCTSDSSSALLSQNLSVPSLFMGTIEVFPNPCSDNLIVKVHETTALKSLEIIDVMGKICINHNTLAHTQFISLDVNTLPAGVYILSTRTSTQRHTQTFVKF